MIVDLINATLSWAQLTFILLSIVRERSVPGTRRRYVMATAQWPLVPLAIAAAPFSLLFDDGTLFWDTLDMINFVIVLVVLRRLINDDDDNSWRRKRKQLKRYLRSFGLRPSLAGARS